MKGCAAHKPVRASVGSIATLALLLVLALPAWAQHSGNLGRFGGMHPAFQRGMERGNRFGQRPPGPGREHLPEWFRQHQNLSPDQQEQALRREPGFNRLSPAQQQRMMQRLRMLDSIPPVERRRILARNEAFERLSPERRQEVRAAAQAFSQMPPFKRRQMRRAFHVLRTLPPPQREEIINSARFRAEYSPRQRNILTNLLSIEPYEPPPPGAPLPSQRW